MTGEAQGRSNLSPPAGLRPLWESEQRALQLAHRNSPLAFASEHPADLARMRGEFLAWLLPRYPKIASGAEFVTIGEVSVVGPVDLRFAQDLPALNFQDCEIPEVLRFASARLSYLRFSNCRIGSIVLGHAALSGSLELERSTLVGVINVGNATIGGSFIISSCKMTGPQIVAVQANNVKMARLEIFDSCIDGRLALIKAEVEGDVSISASALSASGVALHADGIRIGSRLFLTGGTKVSGTISLIGARVGGEVTTRGLRIDSPTEELALDLRRARIEGPVILEAASIVGVVSMLGCDVQGDLLAPGAIIRSSSLFALDLRHGRFKGACSLESAMSVEGALNLYGAEIEGELRLMDVELRKGLDARRTKINAVHIGRGYTSGGPLNFYGSRIVGDFTIIGAYLDAPAPIVLTSAEIGGTVHIDSSTILGLIQAVGATLGSFRVDNSEVGGSNGLALQIDNALVRQSLTVERSKVNGEMSLAGAEISGDFILSDFLLVASPDAKALDATGASIGGSYRAVGARSPVDGLVSFGNCRIGSMEDAEDSWPVSGKLEVDGLIYDRMPGATAATRLKWLALQTEFHAQPFEHLMKLFRGRGDHGEAADIAVQKWRRRRVLRIDSFWHRAWDSVLDVLSGYGYRPARPLLGLIAIFLIGTVIFSVGRQNEVFCPVDTLRLAEPCKPKPQHPQFNPLLYSLEMLVPIGEFGQKRTWIIRGDQDLSPIITSYSVVHRALGWLFALLLALAPTNILRRE